jgi:hypothetical protein
MAAGELRLRTGIVAGAVAGLAGSVVSAVLLSIIGIKGSQQDLVWAMTLVSHSVQSEHMLVGWLVQLLPGTVIGAAFGVLFSALALRPESAAVWAAIYGSAWWVPGWLVVLLHPLTPWRAISDPSRFQLVMVGLLACFGYSVVLAGVFSWLARPARGGPSVRARRPSHSDVAL